MCITPAAEVARFLKAKETGSTFHKVCEPRALSWGSVRWVASSANLTFQVCS